MCLVICNVQMAIIKRHRELWLAVDSTPPPTDNHEPPPISKPSERELFQNPDKLHGKQFVLSPHTDESGVYKVIGYHKRRDNSVQYDVLFDDCEDPILVDAGEMMRMLEDSLYIPN
ncbi:uncharacterized protein EI90DRAFT_3080488 [Cantharellus anzutake]|uniref:uncharacterized protein n=1 Tax=Cantharellus anzutake TaxID=1750568 RepID=UPI001907DEF5|nr:uncharacterized protein EI90DRAFT_3080488 [Cantharellus anzutake]KAF8320525.1 hypothetical protein EI90DRAFT_3080488 [Cantharellus anzutake]